MKPQVRDIRRHVALGIIASSFFSLLPLSTVGAPVEDFSITAVTNPPITISLATNVTVSIQFSELPPIKYEKHVTNQFNSLLFGAQWLMTDRYKQATAITVSAPETKLSVTTESGTVAAQTLENWKGIVGIALYFNRVTGTGVVSFALFDALPSKPRGNTPSFRYGKQVSNVINVPVAAPEQR